MMRYFVLLKDGSKYGPVEITQLQEWIDEGGVLPSARLQNEDTGEELSAGELPELSFPKEAIVKLRRLTSDAQLEADRERRTFRSAWIMVGLSPFVCGFAGCVPWAVLAAPLFPIAGWINANRITGDRAQAASTIRALAMIELAGSAVLVVGLIVLLATGNLPGAEK